MLAAAASCYAVRAASDTLRVDPDALLRDVTFLADSLCGGRRTGTPGGSEAAFYIIRRMRDCGLRVSVQGFSASNGEVGHNIIAGPPANAASTRPMTVVMAYYDGIGKMGDKFYPGADSNASGTAALLALAERLSGRDDVMLVALDGHNANSSGAVALSEALKGCRIRMVVNLDILGATSSPVDSMWPRYLIALGGEPYERTLERCNSGLGLHLYYDYYRSRSFTDLFYRRTGDHKPFLNRRIPCVLFTSGITLSTNRTGDLPQTLDYPVFARRVELIARWLETR